LAETIRGAVLVAGFTSRSRAYSQAMLNAGLKPEKIILFGPEKGGLPGQSGKLPDNSADRTEIGLFLPDHSIPLKETCGQLGCDVKHIPSENINDPDMLGELKAAAPSLVIYSGYGAQIVGREVLEVAPFLHVHSGWLPDERGSTTMYYGWLSRNRCGVSAILMAESIDTGPIIRRKEYSPPPPAVDPDHIYDGAIRADLLIEVLREYEKNREFKSKIPQPTRGTNYYVIHPVLKHLARLRNK